MYLFFAFTCENENESRHYRRNQRSSAGELPRAGVRDEAQQAQSEEKTGINMWQKKCPVCRQLMEKKLPTETVPCTCGKYVWKG